MAEWNPFVEATRRNVSTTPAWAGKSAVRSQIERLEARFRASEEERQQLIKWHDEHAAAEFLGQRLQRSMGDALGTRISLVGSEKLLPLPPLDGLNSTPLLPLLEMAQLVQCQVPDLPSFAQAALEATENLDGWGEVSHDERAAVFLYTMEWTPWTDSLYFVLNKRLRARTDLDVFLPYLRLLLPAMVKIQRRKESPAILWCGVNAALGATYEAKRGQKFGWWGFSSCTRNIAALDPFVKADQPRSLFAISTRAAVAISAFSSFQEEAEFILLPGTQLQVQNVRDMGHGLVIIELEQVESVESIVGLDKLCASAPIPHWPAPVTVPTPARAPDLCPLRIRISSSRIFLVVTLERSLRSGVTVKDRKPSELFATFIGADAIDWLCEHAHSCSTSDWETPKRLSRSEAVLLAQKLLDVGVFRQVKRRVGAIPPLDDRTSLFRFHVDDKEGPLLNCRQIWHYNAREPAVVVTELLRKMLALVSESNALTRLKDGQEMRELTAATAELQLVNVSSLSDSEWTALFLNLFNLMVLHGHIVRSTADMCNFKTQRRSFMRVVQYMVAVYNYSLEDIKSWPYRRVMGSRSLLSKAPDPRVHFAMSLGAMSSPRIRIYTAQGLDRELGHAAVEYCNQIELDEASRVIRLPKIFKWHKDDFGRSKANIVTHCRGAKYAPEHIQRMLTIFVNSKRFKVKYHKFDWRISYEKIRRESQEALEAYNAQPLWHRGAD